MGYERFDIVVVPFPFTDSTTTKRRSALVISGAKAFNLPAGHSVMAMVTSAGKPLWPLDVEITDRDASGLAAASLVRMKLFTLDNRFILRRLGRLGATDRNAVAAILKTLLA